MVTRTAVLLDEDEWMTRRLARLDVEWLAAAAASSPALVVVDLGRTDALEQVDAARRRWPAAVVAGYLAEPDHERWVAGQRAGCDLVANRGALVPRLRAMLAAGDGRARRLYPLLEEADLAGRLGLVACVAETPVGPVALYQVDGAVHAISDRCPHAGARLSEGELDREIVTCPRHGSQFDVTTGERVRGPADDDLAVHRAVVANGQVSIFLGE